MRKYLSLFLIMFCAQATASALAGEDVKVTAVMQGSTTIGGEKIEYPKTGTAEIASVMVEIPPGTESGRHMHPAPTYVYVLEGTLTVEFEDGSRQSFKAGSGFLEGMNTWHNAKNLGEMSSKILVVFAGEEGKPNMIRPEKHQTSTPTK